MPVKRKASVTLSIPVDDDDDGGDNDCVELSSTYPETPIASPPVHSTPAPAVSTSPSPAPSTVQITTRATLTHPHSKLLFGHLTATITGSPYDVISIIMSYHTPINSICVVDTAMNVFVLDVDSVLSEAEADVDDGDDNSFQATGATTIVACPPVVDANGAMGSGRVMFAYARKSEPPTVPGRLFVSGGSSSHPERFQLVSAQPLDCGENEFQTHQTACFLPGNRILLSASNSERNASRELHVLDYSRGGDTCWDPIIVTSDVAPNLSSLSGIARIVNFAQSTAGIASLETAERTARCMGVLGRSPHPDDELRPDQLPRIIPYLRGRILGLFPFPEMPGRDQYVLVLTGGGSTRSNFVVFNLHERKYLPRVLVLEHEMKPHDMAWLRVPRVAEIGANSESRQQSTDHVLACVFADTKSSNELSLLFSPASIFVSGGGVPKWWAAAELKHISQPLSRTFCPSVDGTGDLFAGSGNQNELTRTAIRFNQTHNRLEFIGPETLTADFPPAPRFLPTRIAALHDGGRLVVASAPIGVAASHSGDDELNADGDGDDSNLDGPVSSPGRADRSLWVWDFKHPLPDGKIPAFEIAITVHAEVHQLLVL